MERPNRDDWAIIDGAADRRPDEEAALPATGSGAVLGVRRARGEAAASLKDLLLSDEARADIPLPPRVGGRRRPDVTFD